MSVVRPPGFEPGSAPWKGAILDQARLWPQIQNHRTLWLEFKIIDEMNLGVQVSGRLGSYTYPSFTTPRLIRTGQWKGCIMLVLSMISPYQIWQVSGRLQSYKESHSFFSFDSVSGRLMSYIYRASLLLSRFEQVSRGLSSHIGKTSKIRYNNMIVKS